MIRYAYLDADGCLMELFEGSDLGELPVGATVVPDFVTLEHRFVPGPPPPEPPPVIEPDPVGGVEPPPVEGPPNPEGEPGPEPPAVTPPAAGTWQLRPTLPAPVLVDNHLTWALPPGSWITIEDTVMGDMIADTQEIDIIFTDLGPYLLRAEAPRPFLPREAAIEVTTIAPMAAVPLVGVDPDCRFTWAFNPNPDLVPLPVNPRSIHFEFEGYVTALPGPLMALVRSQHFALNVWDFPDPEFPGTLVFEAQGVAETPGRVRFAWSPETYLQVTYDMHWDAGLPGGATCRLTVNGVVAFEQLSPLFHPDPAIDTVHLFNFYGNFGSTAEVVRVRLAAGGQDVIALTGVQGAAVWNAHPAHLSGTFVDVVSGGTP